MWICEKCFSHNLHLWPLLASQSFTTVSRTWRFRAPRGGKLLMIGFMDSGKPGAVKDGLIQITLENHHHFLGEMKWKWWFQTMKKEIPIENHPLFKGYVSFWRECFYLSSCWLNQAIWKICSSNWIISPGIRGENENYLQPPPRHIYIFQCSILPMLTYVYQSVFPKSGPKEASVGCAFL